MARNSQIEKEGTFSAFIIDKNSPNTVFEALGDTFETLRLDALSKPRNSMAARLAWIRLDNFKNEFMTPIAISHQGKVKIGKTLDYGYAHTIHKSQGGTYKYSYILGDTINSFQDVEMRNQLRYVAITRAESTAVVLTNAVTNLSTTENSILDKSSDFAEQSKKIINVYWGQEESANSTKILSNLAPRKFI